MRVRNSDSEKRTPGRGKWVKRDDSGGSMAVKCECFLDAQMVKSEERKVDE